MSLRSYIHFFEATLEKEISSYFELQSRDSFV